MTYEPIPVTTAWKEYIDATYPIEILKEEQLPFGVDPAKLEVSPPSLPPSLPLFAPLLNSIFPFHQSFISKTTLSKSILE